jgi:hypothetical protein
MRWTDKIRIQKGRYHLEDLDVDGSSNALSSQNIIRVVKPRNEMG